MNPRHYDIVPTSPTQVADGDSIMWRGTATTVLGVSFEIDGDRVTHVIHTVAGTVRVPVGRLVDRIVPRDLARVGPRQ